MSTRSIARGAATRTANMNKRRAHILACAGNIIATQGFEALTLSKLAEKADVTVPTIHNLIGKKAQIYEYLVTDMVNRIGDALSTQETHDPIIAVETFIDKLIDLYATDEALYKAAFVAGEREKLFEHELPSGIFNKSLEVAVQVCENARQRGELLGRIKTRQLAEQLFGCQRLARQDWVNGYIDLEIYRSQVLIGMFMTLAADASPAFHKKLIRTIHSLS